MEPGTQVHLAETLRQRREHLEGALDAIHERGQPIGEVEMRLLKDSLAVFDGIADQLRLDGQNRARWAVAQAKADANHLMPFELRLRSLSSRIRGLIRPRIGVLRQYPPRPLWVPTSYLNQTLPHPTPTISMVTPSYAQGRFLQRTISSVLDQGYPELEYFVQDGGSTDDTLEILRAHDRRLTGWCSEPDEGQADAINRGFSRTTGEIMGWLNSDDCLMPGALACVGRYFVDHPDVDVLYGNRVMIDENDSQIGLWILPSHNDLALTLADFVPQETLFWRRSIWDAVGGGVDPAFGYALDWDLLLRFREAGANMVHVPRFLGAFRVHEHQKTSAEEVLGAKECAQLRIRVHGRAMDGDEITRRLRPYLRRHVIVHNRQRLVDRLPLRRVEVHLGRSLRPNAPALPVAHVSSKVGESSS
jgi:GT2 family glycosyltransferase